MLSITCNNYYLIVNLALFQSYRFAPWKGAKFQQCVRIIHNLYTYRRTRSRQSPPIITSFINRLFTCPLISEQLCPPFWFIHYKISSCLRNKCVSAIGTFTPPRIFCISSSPLSFFRWYRHPPYAVFNFNQSKYIINVKIIQ